MPEQDPLSSFLDNLTEKIRVTKEHKNIMEAVYASASGVEVVDEQKDPFANFLQKIGNTIAEKLPQKEIVPVIEEVVVEPQKENTTPQIKTDATIVLGNKIKEALQRAKTLGPIETVKKEEPIKISQIQPEPLDIENTPVEVKGEEDDNKSTRDLGEKIRAAIEKAKEKALNPEAVEDENKPEDEQITTYINELEKIKDTGTVKQQEEANTTLKELKEYIDKTVKDYSRRILELGGGGGSVAVQYANGGTMNGDLNVNGHILSGGRNIANYFGTGGGGGGGDPAVNAVVYSNSANWNAAYSNLVTNSAAYLSGYDLEPYATKNYVITNFLAVTGGTVTGDTIFSNNLTVQGNLTALGTSTFKNTLFTTTTALSVVNTGPGPALYVYQAAGPYDVASFYDGDGIEVLHIGNAEPNGLGKVGINESFPTVELTVNGQISGNKDITVLGGNSNQWNEAYTNLVTNSASYFLSGTDVNLGDIPTLSGNWNSNYTTTNYFSAFWNAAVDELFNFYITQTDPGSAFISEDGNYYIIANSKLDNVDLWNNVFTQVFLLSSQWSSVYVAVLGNSARWDSVYTSFNQNSARYNSVYTTTQTASGSWSSVYNTYRSLSASYAAETLAIAYAVAL